MNGVGISKAGSVVRGVLAFWGEKNSVFLILGKKKAPREALGCLDFGVEGIFMPSAYKVFHLQEHEIACYRDFTL